MFEVDIQSISEVVEDEVFIYFNIKKDRCFLNHIKKIYFKSFCIKIFDLNGAKKKGNNAFLNNF